MSRVVGRFAVLALLVALAGCKAGDESGSGYMSGDSNGAPGDGDGDGDGGGGGSGAGSGPVVEGDQEYMPGTDPGRNDVRPGRICRRLAEIQCAAEAFCCDTPRWTRETCTQEMERGCVEEFGLDALASEAAAGFDAARAAEAFQKFEDLGGACDPTIALWASRDDGLRGIMRGTLTDTCPLDVVGAAGGADELEAARAALASCSLDDNLACRPSLVGVWSCQPRGGAETECFTDFNCAEGFYCDNPNTVFAGVNCSPRKPAGQSCQYFRECASMICSDGVCVDGDVQGAYCLQ